MSEFLESLAVGEPLFERRSDPVIEREAMARAGMVSEMLHYVLPSRWLVEAVTTPTRRSYASADEINLAEFAASQENACRHCYGAMRSVLRLLGHSEAQILRLERDRQTMELGARGRGVYDFARALARSDPRPARPELQALDRLGFSRNESTEIALNVAIACFLNRLGTALAIPPDANLEAMPSRWIVRLLAPLVRRKMRGRPVPPPAAPHPTPEVPFGMLIPLLGPVPGAASLAGTMEAAFRSDVLTRRAKTLAFAVVARTIGCGVCEAEARRALEDEGIDAAEAERILAHLASPALDPVEALLVPYARETVRYRPAQIQQRTRELLAALGPDRTLEAVGITALANGVVRLGMLAEC